MNECKHIQFAGFNPSLQTRNYLEDVFNQILYMAPYNSALKALFCKKKNQYKIMVQINSISKRFFAISSHSHLKKATDLMDHQLREQIDKWKTTRFDSTSLKDFLDMRDIFSSEGDLHERDIVA